VFLDYFEADAASAPRLGFHPHSGIATLTLVLSGHTYYKESNGHEGIVGPGGAEWMRASSGIWHTGALHGEQRSKGFQLWVAMPPSLELAEPHSQYFDAADFQYAGPARVIVGEYAGSKSAVAAPPGMIYLDVRLAAGERWRFKPPQGYDVAWAAVYAGSLSAADQITAGEMVVFEAGEMAIEFEAIVDTGFVLGAAIQHPYDLVTGYYSVHTSAAALQQGERNIALIGQQLQRQGLL
jgi:redox-sensitive bicupin YhaK (pirin superfamily)